jgi:nicotinamide-nucleotide amidase
VRPIVTADILAVGSELLTPHRVDTNSLFLTGRLNDLGIAVRMKSAIRDNPRELTAALTNALSNADLIVTTGGLGPTADDLTREAVADLLGLELVERPDVLAVIQERFARRGAAMPAINRRQAMAPEGAIVLPNPNGTAPGLLLEQGDRMVVLLPGPPREMQPMFDGWVVPRLADRTRGRRLHRRVLKVTGRSESQVEEVAEPIYAAAGTAETPVETTILASPGQIELHLSSAGDDGQTIGRVLDEAVARLAEALGDVVFSVDGRSIEEVVGDLLHRRGWRVAVAESCTGGALMARLTDVPGASAWVLGGVVAYANEVKIAELGVPAGLIERHGAVSEETAGAMAEGVRARLHAEIGVSITGIAGPGGGSPEKPVGTVVVAVTTGAGTSVRRFWFPGEREVVRRFSAMAALDMLRRALSTS